MTQSVKGKRKLEEGKTDVYCTFKTSEDSEDDEVFNVEVGHAISAVVSEMTSKPRKQRSKDKVHHTEFWEQGYIYWDDKEFKQRMRVSRQIFNYILTEIDEYIEKTPLNLNPAPTSSRVHLASTLYRLGHGSTYPVVADIFGVSEPIACKVFNHVCWILAAWLNDENVYVGAPVSTHKSRLLQKTQGYINNLLKVKYFPTNVYI